ncbi:hypothetical protein PV10_08903 [Exophiala mesophila]|uniref:FAD/NAD(P)-binding domain-containing protein n=1 Tax=Exophiala mesophila TaxID=212818 RepID=A0A0D1Z3H7_EXOME|nr:uncharacterized protein PV10_08903 [Exophiala mesophila]KIV89327.1 hypothetical protein PV10_08903 [Exophiala mesophila]
MGSIGYDYDFIKPSSTSNASRPIDEARPLKVIYIGAGVSGILAAIEFLKAVPSLELVIYEKNPEVGGTWYENKYPGCACDIPSHAYQLSFESWTEWSQFYSGAPEILQYWKMVAEKYRVRDFVRFQHKCVEARWDESRSKWTTKFLRLDSAEPSIVEDEADVLITGTGLLNDWKWPSIEGLQDFKGPLLHTANWDESFDVTGKKVAVIGAGSSGIQVVPAIVNKVSAMDHYVRGKTWISTQFSQDLLEETTHNQSSNFDYSQEQKQQWRDDPKSYIKYRKDMEFGLQSTYDNVKLGSQSHARGRRNYERHMRERLSAKPELAEQLIPDFPPLCKRLTPGPGYLEALMQSHVALISQSIVSVDAKGITTADGVYRQVDAIICATGFETSPGQGFPIYGEDGVNLREKYAVRPKTYLGLCTNNFPNFFQSLGPNSFQGAGTLLVMMEQAHKYMAQILRRMAYGDLKTIQPKKRQVENFTSYCDKYFENTVYTAGCASWYTTKLKDPTGAGNGATKVTALWPGSSVHYLRAMESVRWEDYELENIDTSDFGWFGNGRTVGEVGVTQDAEALTWYLNQTNFLGDLYVDSNASEIIPSNNGFVEDSKPQIQEKVDLLDVTVPRIEPEATYTQDDLARSEVKGEVLDIQSQPLLHLNGWNDEKGTKIESIHHIATPV